MKKNRKTPRLAHGQKWASRPTIGMLTTWLVEIHQVQWLGAVDAARAHQVNLICFAGKELGRPDNFYAQANIVFDLVSAQQLDGLIIWSTTLQAFIGRQKMEEFCQRYQPLPMISVEQVMTGLPSLVMDNKQGMREAVSHLIEVHGHRRIAFIRGPEKHPGAQERYLGYVEALAQHGLPLDSNLVPAPPPYWLPEEASARVKRLLREQTTAMDAIVAANDDLALGVLLALQAQHIRVPDDIAVVGFDNKMNIERPDLGVGSISGDPAEANLATAVNIGATTLPLTTVKPPFYELGWQSVELLLAQLRGEPAAAVVTVPTELIVRRSCGCFSEAVRQVLPQPFALTLPTRSMGETFTEAISAQREYIITQMKQELIMPAVKLAPDWADRLLTAYIKEIQGEPADAFLVVLDDLLRTTIRAGSRLQLWWPVLFALRRHTLPYLMSGEDLARVENLWQRVQSLMGEIIERFHMYQQLLAAKQGQILREIGQRLITTLDIGQLAEVMAQELPNLGIKSCYLSLYEPHPRREGNLPAKFAAEGTEGYPTEWSRAILIYENKQRLDLSASEALFPSQQLLPGQRLRREQPYSMVVEPLYFKDQQLGFVLFELGLREGWVYEVLRGQLSSALQSALLVEQTQEKNRLLQQEIGQRQRAEAALQKAHSELEKRVSERTAELATANQFLTEQIIERERAEAMQTKLEAQLRQAQKMEAIGRLAGGIAHDFNNLLVVIIGYSNLLLSHLPADESSRNDIAQIKKAGERAAALTRQLLAFSRQQVLQPRLLNLNSIVTNIKTMLQRLIGEDVKLDTLLEPTLASVTADPGQIEQIIVNLAVNARDAMPQGGKLTLATANLYLDQDYARQNVGVKPGPYVMLMVSDSGIGMDATTQARLFEPFFTTKPPGKGTGLGLATVFGIVEQSGGHLAVASQPDQGTTFKIYLPQSEQSVEEIEPDWILIPASSTGTETILLVEDDPGVRTVTRRFLEEHGYTVLEAAHGLEALHLCQQHQGPIHLLITDVVMPGMSGRELVDRLEHIRPEIPVLYISGYTDSAMIRHGVSEATITLLQKPFTAESLTRKVREVLDVTSRE